MTTFHLRVYVGPTLVGSMAREFRASGLTVTVEGTAHVHVSLETDADPREALIAQLRATWGHAFCLTAHDVQVVRREAR